MPSQGGTTRQITENKLPEELEGAAKANLDIADSVNQIGPVFNDAPQLAPLSQPTIFGLNNLNKAQAAFGLPALNGGDYTKREEFTGIPDSTLVKNPVTGQLGYSGVPSMRHLVDQLPPAQRQLIDSFFMDPQTGQQPANTTVPRSKFDVAQQNIPISAVAKLRQELRAEFAKKSKKTKEQLAMESYYRNSGYNADGSRNWGDEA